MKLEIHNALISDLAALTYTGSTNTIFASVEKVYRTLPTSFPTCEVMPVSSNVIVEGNSSDTREYAFTLTTYELIENSTTQDIADLKIDRLDKIEDELLNYCEKLPNNLGVVSGASIYDVQVDSVEYNYAADDKGIILVMVLQLTLKTIVTPQNL